jgi:hypothetical protein
VAHRAAPVLFRTSHPMLAHAGGLAPARRPRSR